MCLAKEKRIEFVESIYSCNSTEYFSKNTVDTLINIRI